MARGGFLFARLALDYADHPKIGGLSDAAFRAHITMILYARKYETDGIIRNRVANRLASEWDTDVLHELQNNDENTPSLIRLPNGDYMLHGYADMQETRDEIDARRRTNSRNGAKGGRPSKGVNETQSVSNSKTQSVSEPGTQKKAETETETETDKEEEDTSDSGESDDIRADVQEVIDHMVAALEANDVRKSKVGKSWHTSARLLIDKDGYTVEQIKWITTWATTHHFWKSNILSMPKLREKFDQLKLQATTERPASNIDQRRAENVQRISQRQPWSPNQQDPSQWGAEEVRALGR